MKYFDFLLQRLKAAVHYTVGCLCEEVASDREMPFSKQTIAAISELTFRQCGTNPGPSSLWIEIPQVAFVQEKCVAGCCGWSYQQTENITVGCYSRNISFLGCKIQVFYGNIYF